MDGKGWLIDHFQGSRTGLNGMVFRVRFAYILLAVTYLLVILSLLLACQPFRKWWQVYPYPGGEQD